MSIWASIFGIEDERQWMADMEAAGIKARVIRDGDPSFDDQDAPIIYQGSHVMPTDQDPRGGSLDLALIPDHVRYWREMEPPYNELSEEEKARARAGQPEGNHEPWLRLSLYAHPSTYGGGGDATVLLTVRQARRLRDALDEWLQKEHDF